MDDKEQNCPIEKEEKFDLKDPKIEIISKKSKQKEIFFKEKKKIKNFFSESSEERSEESSEETSEENKPKQQKKRETKEDEESEDEEEKNFSEKINFGEEKNLGEIKDPFDIFSVENLNTKIFFSSFKYENVCLVELKHPNFVVCCDRCKFNNIISVVEKRTLVFDCLKCKNTLASFYKFTQLHFNQIKQLEENGNIIFFYYFVFF